MRIGRGSIAPYVFWPALVLIGGFVLFAAIAPETAGEAIGGVQSGIIDSLGWYYVLLIAAFVVFCLWVGASRFGDIRLGRDDQAPEFGLRSWFAMLFSAGMGIGLVFWGVAEPLNHFVAPRPGFEGDTEASAAQAITQTYLHWGVHAWAIYVVVGLAVGYAVHRRGRPVSIRWAVEPLLGDRVKGRLGDLIDVVAVVGTVFGVATSLGFGVAQIAAGFEFTGIADSTTALQVGLVVGITAVATMSVVTGLGRGIKWLSNVNMGLAVAILLAVLVLGPTIFLLREFVQSFGDYFANVVRLTFNVSAFRGEEGEAFQAAWTTFYWGWWISWAPFVGVFIARISRGRTIREFVTGVLVVPTLVSFLWFSVMGGTALYREIFGGGGLVGEDGTVGTEAALFGMLDGLPGGSVIVGVAILLIVTFFVTSSDSGSLVVDMLASGGDPDPPVWSRVLWAVLEGAVAAVLLVVGAASGANALSALQTASIITALPFSLVMILMMVSLVKVLRHEHSTMLRRRQLRELEHLTERVSENLADTAATSGSSGNGTGTRSPASAPAAAGDRRASRG
ncbi:BCCT family transporter [Thalassiella azotivora]